MKKRRMYLIKKLNFKKEGEKEYGKIINSGTLL